VDYIPTDRVALERQTQDVGRKKINVSQRRLFNEYVR
jgi:hypothetical protein